MTKAQWCLPLVILAPRADLWLIEVKELCGPACGRTYAVTCRNATIGREEGEIRIADPGVSRRHASVEVHDAETVILRDLSSTNGTFHNDQLIAFSRLRDGDEVAFLPPVSGGSGRCSLSDRPLDVAETVARVLDRVEGFEIASLEDFRSLDRESREIAKNLVKSDS